MEETKLVFRISIPGKEASTVEISEPHIYIGRAPVVNDLCIDHPSLSRQHAHIKHLKAGYMIEDLKSLNGTKINGKKVTKSDLRDGDKLLLGKVSVEVRYELLRPGKKKKKVSVSQGDVRKLEEKMAITTMDEKKPPKSSRRT